MDGAALTEHLCVAPGCAVRGEHVRDCDNTTCRGCRPAFAEDGAFCPADTSKLRNWLGDIPELFTDVVDPPGATDTATDIRGVRDPVARDLPAGTVPGAARQPRVSGSTEDMLAARYVEAAGGTIRPIGLPVDQVGDPPPAVLLDSWARDWQLIRDMGETLPAPTVSNLCRWLADRLPWALEHHGAMPEFHDEIHGLHSRLWAEAGRGEPKPEHCKAVPCKRCDRLTLYRSTDGSGDVECRTADCGRVYRRTEYDEWAKLIAAPAHRDWLTERAAREKEVAGS